METSSIVILDFGSQYTQLIARRIRAQNVFSVVLPCSASVAEIQSHHPIGLILSGGPCSVYDPDAPAAWRYYDILTQIRTELQEQSHDRRTSF